MDLMAAKDTARSFLLQNLSEIRVSQLFKNLKHELDLRTSPFMAVLSRNRQLYRQRVSCPSAQAKTGCMSPCQLRCTTGTVLIGLDPREKPVAPKLVVQ